MDQRCKWQLTADIKLFELLALLTCMMGNVGVFVELKSRGETGKQDIQYIRNRF